MGNVCGVNSVFPGPCGLASRAIDFAAKHCLNSFETDEDPWHWRPLDRCREAGIVKESSSQVCSQLLIWLQPDRPSPRVRLCAFVEPGSNGNSEVAPRSVSDLAKYRCPAPFFVINGAAQTIAQMICSKPGARSPSSRPAK